MNACSGTDSGVGGLPFEAPMQATQLLASHSPTNTTGKQRIPHITTHGMLPPSCPTGPAFLTIKDAVSVYYCVSAGVASRRWLLQ